MRFFKSRMVRDRVRMENHHVGKVTGPERATPFQLEVPGGQAGETPDGRFERNELFIADIFSQQTGKGPISARVRIGFEENALRGG